MPIEILCIVPWGPMERRLEADFQLHRLWLHEDQKAFLREVGPNIRGMITFGGAPVAVDSEFLRLVPKLEIIVNAGAGYESIDVPAARARGIVVTNAGSSCAMDVAEAAFGLLLAVARNVVGGDHYARSGDWVTKGRMQLTHRVGLRPLGIVGLGRIGLEIAKRATAFEMPVSYHNRRPRTDVAYRYVPDLVTLAAEVDFLIAAAPGGAATHHLIDRPVMDALGPNGILVNIGRGSVVDEAALVEALVDGRLGGAGLDVFEHEPEISPGLRSLPNVVLQPHTTGATYECVDALVDLGILNLKRHFAGEPVLTPVD